MSIKDWYHRVIGSYLRKLNQAPPTPARKFDRGYCPSCGELVPLRKDGLPSARWHSCEIRHRVEGADFGQPGALPICPVCRSVLLLVDGKPRPCSCQEAA